MKLVKIFTIHNMYNDCDESYTSRIGEGISDWEEISDEQFRFLKTNLWRCETPLTGNNERLVIIEKGEQPATYYIDSIKKLIDNQMKKQQEEQAEKERKKQEAAERRAAKKLENNRKALERLLKDNPQLIQEVVKDVNNA